MKEQIMQELKTEALKDIYVSLKKEMTVYIDEKMKELKEQLTQPQSNRHLRIPSHLSVLNMTN